MLHITNRSATFRAGQNIRYFSSGLRCWVSATIKGFNHDGSMNLDEQQPANSSHLNAQPPQVAVLTTDLHRHTCHATQSTESLILLLFPARVPASDPNDAGAAAASAVRHHQSAGRSYPAGAKRRCLSYAFESIH